MIDPTQSVDRELTIDVHGLSKHYPIRAALVPGNAAPLKAVDDVSFSIARGEVLGLAGESGSGKSTTGAMLLGLERPTAGAIHFTGLGLIDPCDRRIRRTYSRVAQLVFQNPYEALNPRHTVATSIREPLEIHFPRDRATQERLLIRAMERAGLRPHCNFADRYPHELSGGQLQRVAIARAIALEPSLLVADEPVAMLDVSIRAGILNLFREFAEGAGMAILYVSHDLSTMRHVCGRVAVMYRGRIIEIGAAADVLDAPRHPYTRALAAAVPGLQPRSARPAPSANDLREVVSQPKSGCLFHPRCAAATDRCRAAVPSLRTLPEGRAVACHLVEGEAREGGIAP